MAGRDSLRDCGRWPLPRVARGETGDFWSIRGMSDPHIIRHCSRCERPCAESDFHRGEMSRCKECARARAAQWRARRRANRPPRTPARDTSVFIATAHLQRAIAEHGERAPSARSLARSAGIDVHTAADIIAGRRQLTTLRVADRICMALGLHIDMLPLTGPAS